MADDYTISTKPFRDAVSVLYYTDPAHFGIEEEARSKFMMDPFRGFMKSDTETQERIVAYINAQIKPPF